MDQTNSGAGASTQGTTLKVERSTIVKKRCHGCHKRKKEHWFISLHPAKRPSKEIKITDRCLNCRMKNRLQMEHSSYPKHNQQALRIALVEYGTGFINTWVTRAEKDGVNVSLSVESELKQWLQDNVDELIARRSGKAATLAHNPSTGQQIVQVKPEDSDLELDIEVTDRNRKHVAPQVSNRGVQQPTAKLADPNDPNNPNHTSNSCISLHKSVHPAAPDHRWRDASRGQFMTVALMDANFNKEHTSGKQVAAQVAGDGPEQSQVVTSESKVPERQSSCELGHFDIPSQRLEVAPMGSNTNEEHTKTGEENANIDEESPNTNGEHANKRQKICHMPDRSTVPDTGRVQEGLSSAPRSAFNELEQDLDLSNPRCGVLSNAPEIITIDDDDAPDQKLALDGLYGTYNFYASDHAVGWGHRPLSPHSANNPVLGEYSRPLNLHDTVTFPTEAHRRSQIRVGSHPQYSGDIKHIENPANPLSRYEYGPINPSTPAQSLGRPLEEPHLFSYPNVMIQPSAETETSSACSRLTESLRGARERLSPMDYQIMLSRMAVANGLNSMSALIDEHVRLQMSGHWHRM